MIKRIKDESQLMGKWKISAGKKNYFHVFLWPSQETFDQNTYDNKPGESSGCVNLAPPYIEVYKDGTTSEEMIRPKLGEVHFIKDKWDMEVVAHELFHALMHRLRFVKPSAEDIMEQVGSSEEDVAYEFGRWVDKIYRKLWEKDSEGSKWERIGP